MKWTKRGLLFRPNKQRPWMCSHATMPTAYFLRNRTYRVYFGTRDARNHARIGFVDFDIQSPQDVLDIADEPVLDIGRPGAFDDNGVYPSCVFKHDGRFLLFYAGRSQGNSGVFRMAIGLAVAHSEEKTFQRISEFPILDRGEFDPWCVSTPFVLIDNGIWRMWYLSGLSCSAEHGRLNSLYHIKYAESKDGTEWKRDGRICIDFKENETNICRPCVLKENGVYRMWYSYHAGKGYRIGYAESDDGYVWCRRDKDVGIGVSDTGWDSEALAYPWVLKHDKRMYMFYNGNSFGRDGFGLAMEEQGHE